MPTRTLPKQEISHNPESRARGNLSATFRDSEFPLPGSSPGRDGIFGRVKRFFRFLGQSEMVC